MNPNHAYLQGLRDGLLIANNITDMMHLEDTTIKHINSEFAKAMISINNILHAVNKNE